MSSILDILILGIPVTEEIFIGYGIRGEIYVSGEESFE